MRSRQLGKVFSNVGKAFTSIGKAIFTPLKGVFSFMAVGINSITTAVFSIGQKLTSAFTTVGIKEVIAKALTTNIIGTVVNIGANKIFDEIGMHLTNRLSSDILCLK